MRSQSGNLGPPLSNSLSRQAGLSLLEVALALAVLTFGLGGVVSLYLSSERSADLTRQRMAAEMLASRKAEALKAAGFNALREHIASHATADKPNQAVYPSGAPLETGLLGQVGAGPDRLCLWRAELELLSPEGGAPSYVRVDSIVEWGVGSSERKARERLYVFE